MIQVHDLHRHFGGFRAVDGASLTIETGSITGLIGPNGAGKSTLFKMLTGNETPDEGTVTIGDTVKMSYVDQSRDALDANKTVWEEISGGAEQIDLGDAQMNSRAYASAFNFKGGDQQKKVGLLSGGERNRVHMAKLLKSGGNLLLLDEPTNDLDIETLDLLQDILGEYDGTVLLVSHDRDFIDRVADTTVAMEGDGQATVYAGGWSDYQAQRGETAPEEPVAVAKAASVAEKPKAAARDGLTFTERHRLEALPAIIARLEAEIAKLTDFLSDPELFTREPAKFAKASSALTERQDALSRAEEEWLELEERASG